MESGDPVLLVIGSGFRDYREYLLVSMSRRFPLWLFDEEEPTWQARYVVGWTVLNPFEAGDLVAAARALASSRTVLGLVCYDEALILPAAHVVAALGLSGMSVRAVQQCRDKHRTRQVLADAGVPQPRSLAVSSLEEARAAAAAVGYPVVLKPRGLGASQGVVKAEDVIGLELAFADASSASYPGVPTYDRGILVEEFLDGAEISVDGFVHEGAYEPVFLARKEVGLDPYFEELGHIVTAEDPLLQDADLRLLLSAVHDALEIRQGITHTEVRLTSRGPRLVEVNGRLGGDLIPYLGLLATGIDPGEMAVDVSVGARPQARATRHRSYGIRFLYPPQDCRVASVRVPPPDPELGIYECVPLVTRGTELQLPPKGYVSRYAYVICHADGPAECAARLEAAASLITLDFEPLVPRATS